jgi:hemerythrin-like domain-containing protein
MAGGIFLHQIGQPGQNADAVGLDAPFEMLSACHERVERSLALLERLQQHLQNKGWDEQAAQAARDVKRYFDLAAPLHHQDEELHVFPPLLAAGDAAVCTVVRRLQQDHVAMEANWQRARTVLQRVAEPASPGGWVPLSASEQADLRAFAEPYARHIEDEEKLVYPAAQPLIQGKGLQAMSADMRVRRGAKG